jgi:hypothetical protein
LVDMLKACVMRAAMPLLITSDSFRACMWRFAPGPAGNNRHSKELKAMRFPGDLLVSVDMLRACVARVGVAPPDYVRDS